MTSQQRILILDGHTNQALACARSLGRSGYAVMAASHHYLPLAAWSRFCRGSYRLTGETVPAFSEMRAWAHRQGVSLVLPLSERSCLLCNAERRDWEALGIKVGCGPDEMLINAFDKVQTALWAVSCGVRIPSTRFPKSLEECFGCADEVGYPCVVKPRRSNAWNGSSFLPNRAPAYVTHRDGLEPAVMSRKQGDYWPLVQRYVEGRGKGIFALYDHGESVAWFAHERLRDVRPSGSRSTLRRSIQVEPRLQEPAATLLTALRWHGPAMVEFRDNGKEPPCLMEINGRLWGSLELAIRAGVDFPRLWISILNGEKVENITNYIEGLALRWLWGDVKRFLLILSGPPSGYTGHYPTAWEGIKELFGPQPEGTRLEMWQLNDPGPAIGEWLEGARGLWVRYCSMRKGISEEPGERSTRSGTVLPTLKVQSIRAEN
jgi:predicted ATP-grasp superfamily ATP-dependent carboligase